MESKTKTNSLNQKQLANLIFHAFTVVSDEQSIHYGQTDSVYSWIPTNIIELISSYLELYNNNNDDNIDDINLIINVDEYLNNPEYWIYQFSKILSEEYNKIVNPIEIDFEKEYVIIEYKKDDLSFLQELDSELFNQLIDMCRWIDGEKMRRRAINSFNPTQVKVKNMCPEQIINKYK